MNSTKTLTSTTPATMAPSMAAATGLRAIQVSEPIGNALCGARVRGVDVFARSYAPSAYAIAPSAYAIAPSAISRVALPSHVALATRAMDDAWAAKKGIPAPRGGPA